MTKAEFLQELREDHSFRTEVATILGGELSVTFERDWRDDDLSVEVKLGEEGSKDYVSLPKYND